jgi:hypothetical protein
LRIQAGKTAALLTGDKTDGWEGIYEQYGSAWKVDPESNASRTD